MSLYGRHTHFEGNRCNPHGTAVTFNNKIGEQVDADADDQFIDDMKHGEGLEDYGKVQEIRIPITFNGSLTQFDNDPSEGKILTTYKLTADDINAMKFPDSQTNKNAVPLADRKGNSKKAVFLEVNIEDITNEHNKGFDLFVDGVKNSTLGYKGLCTAHIFPNQKHLNHPINISEPDSILTPQMLQLEYPLDRVALDITHSNDSKDPYSTFRVRYPADENGDVSITSAIWLLSEMIENGTIKGMNLKKAEPADVDRMDIPREIAQMVLDEAAKGAKIISEGFIDLEDFKVNIKSSDSAKFCTFPKYISSQVPEGLNGSNKKKMNKTIGESRDVHVLLHIKYAMLE